MKALPRAWRTVRLIASCAVLVLGVSLAGWWVADRFTSANRAEAVTALAQRCALQMANDTCRVKNGPAPASTAGRVFIAGVGEVDSAAYSEMQRWGEAMCENVRTQCQAAWDGASCRIAKALYPAAPG
jgi:S-adenosylhomocysteine hydrolase